MNDLQTLQRIQSRCAPVFFALLLSFSLAACGGGGAGGGGDDPLSPENENLDPLHIFVDGVIGSDGNPGTNNFPFKTITHALALVQPGGLIRAREALYDRDNGENFPLRVPFGVRLVGTSETNNKPQIVGMGIAPSEISSNAYLATIVLGEQSRLVGFHLMEGGEGSGSNRSIVAMPYARASISNCRITDGLRGIHWMHEALSLSVEETSISGTSAGLLIEAGNNSRVEETRVRFNSYGVYYNGIVENVDFGGGAEESDGNNTFAENAEADLYTGLGNHVIAQNNFWDHKPPTDYQGSNPPIGVDVLRGMASTIDTTDAKLTGLVVSPAPGPITNGF